MKKTIIYLFPVLFLYFSDSSSACSEVGQEEVEDVGQFGLGTRGVLTPLVPVRCGKLKPLLENAASMRRQS